MTLQKRYKQIILLVFSSYLCSLPLLQATTPEKTDHMILTLEEYLNRVGRGNLDYIAERLNVDIADAEIIAAKVLPDPEIEFEAGEEYYSIELGYSLELGNKRKARTRVARNEAELARLTTEFFFRELRVEATDAFLEAVKEREILRFKRSSYEYMYQLSVSDSIRFKLGEITENEARQSRLEAASLMNEVYEQEAAYKSALIILNQYMGELSGSLYAPEGNLDIPFIAFDLKQLVEMALVNRIDLMAALKNSELAVSQLKMVKAERKIDLGLMVGYERDWEGFFPKRDMLKAGFTVPLPFSNTNKGSIKAAKFAIEQSKVEHNSLELQIQTEVAQAYFNYEAMKKQVDQFHSVLLEDAQRLLDGIVYTYQRGETDILEVLIAQRTYNEIQEQYLETLKGYSSALVELERACGTWNITK